MSNNFSWWFSLKLYDQSNALYKTAPNWYEIGLKWQYCWTADNYFEEGEGEGVFHMQFKESDLAEVAVRLNLTKKYEDVQFNYVLI